MSSLAVLAQTLAPAVAQVGGADDLHKWVIPPPLAAAAHQQQIIDQLARIAVLKNDRAAGCQDGGLPKKLLETIIEPDSDLHDEFRALGGETLMRFQYDLMTDPPYGSVLSAMRYPTYGSATGVVTYPRYGGALRDTMPGVEIDYREGLDKLSITRSLSGSADAATEDGISQTFDMTGLNVKELSNKKNYQFTIMQIQDLYNRESIDIGFLQQGSPIVYSLEAIALRNALDGVLELPSFFPDSVSLDQTRDFIWLYEADLLKKMLGLEFYDLRLGDPGFDPDPIGLQTKLDCIVLTGVMGDHRPAQLNCADYGDESKNHCFLPVLSVLKSGELRNNCSGTIIGAYHVVTAAHCVCKFPGGVAFGTGVRPNILYEEVVNDAAVPFISLRHDYVAKDGLASTVVSVGEVLFYNDDEKEFLCQSPRKKSGDDLALIRIVLPKPFPVEVRAVLIGPPQAGSAVNVVGFSIDPAAENGKAGIKRYGSSMLKELDEDFLTVFDSEALGRDTCQGDSGSGAYIRLADGRLGIFGVLSLGETDCRVVGESYYVRITEGKRLEWLREHVPELIFVEAPRYAHDHDQCIGLKCSSNQGDNFETLPK